MFTYYGITQKIQKMVTFLGEQWFLWAISMEQIAFWESLKKKWRAGRSTNYPWFTLGQLNYGKSPIFFIGKSTINGHWIDSYDVSLPEALGDDSHPWMSSSLSCASRPQDLELFTRLWFSPNNSRIILNVAIGNPLEIEVFWYILMIWVGKNAIERWLGEVSCFMIFPARHVCLRKKWRLIHGDSVRTLDTPHSEMIPRAPIPIGSMYAIYIYKHGSHQYTPNVSIYI